MSANLTRLNIADVDDSGSSVGAYVKRVSIAEVVDSDGKPWEPVPGPDPFDDRTCCNVHQKQPGLRAMSTLLVRLSLVPSATFTGGTGNETYRSRVQYKSASR